MRRMALRKGQHLFNEISQNQHLREAIVDLADLWDGEESQKYGKQLQNILDELGIKDTPKFYSKENLNKIITELIEEREMRKK